MTSQEKDRYIHERMRWCWHESPLRGGSDGYGNCWVNYSCVHCGYKHNFLKGPLNLDLTTWEGFGKLWEACQTQEWWLSDDFFASLDDEILLRQRKVDMNIFINPTRFRDAVYNYFQEAEK